MTTNTPPTPTITRPTCHFPAPLATMRKPRHGHHAPAGGMRRAAAPACAILPA